MLTEIEQITLSDDSLESQLERVDKEIWKGSQKHSTLTQIEDISKKLTSLGVSNNPHTTLSHEGLFNSVIHSFNFFFFEFFVSFVCLVVYCFVDLVMQWAQFTEFLNQKKNAVEEQIIVTKYLLFR